MPPRLICAFSLCPWPVLLLFLEISSKEVTSSVTKALHVPAPSWAPRGKLLLQHSHQWERLGWGGSVYLVTQRNAQAWLSSLHLTLGDLGQSQPDPKLLIFVETKIECASDCHLHVSGSLPISLISFPKALKKGLFHCFRELSGLDKLWLWSYLISFQPIVLFFFHRNNSFVIPAALVTEKVK